MRGFTKALLAAGFFATPLIQAQPLGTLRDVPVPAPAGSEFYVRNQEALVALGKALFWDMQASSDGRTACATCHFHAGADHRLHNQLVDPNHAFPVNTRLDYGSFPLRKLADPGNRNSDVVWDTEMRVGSAGLFRRLFGAVVPGAAPEQGSESLDKPEFSVGGVQVRRVTVRNAPTVINAVFHVRNFWDGRAERIFNASDPFGGNTASPRPVLEAVDGQLVRHDVRLDQSSLASQAMGPILDPLEMSYEGRGWVHLGRKVLSLAPLAYQKVAADDSVLGPMAKAEGRGLRDDVTYRGMIEAAFQPRFWQSAQTVSATGEANGPYSQAEYNFPLFWGLAIQAYETTLVSAETPFDRFMEGDSGALTAEEQTGMRLFQQNGRCTQCHGGPEFTAASFTALNRGGRRGGNAGRAFQRTGVRATVEDTGRGNGAFKSSSLRNVELTGPYFHNGGQATLEQVVAFYSRGGDFTPTSLRAFNANATQQAALAAFLRALTDDRVRFERAPFDHPELCVPSGHPEAAPGVLARAGSAEFPAAASERLLAVPAVGAGGNGVPLQTFRELLTGEGSDGSRAHAMQAACTAPLTR
ncbi:MAG: cytochrome c peroxidase [Bryobacteraceae bacterium]